MLRLIFTLLLCAHLLMPIAANAQSAMRSPLAYSLAEYGLMLGIAIFGGVVSWYRKVRRGEIPSWGLGYLIGEMTLSAFSGLLVFWICEWRQVPQILTASLAGVAGLSSAKLLTLAENFAQRMAEKKLGITAEKGP